MGGGSDTNIINSSGIKAINLSCVMQNIHSSEEFILIKDLINGTKLVLSIIETVP
jgi:tripeptide aminopeptidase